MTTKGEILEYKSGAVCVDKNTINNAREETHELFNNPISTA
jgi:hypothetical protein